MVVRYMIYLLLIYDEVIHVLFVVIFLVLKVELSFLLVAIELVSIFYNY
jgi:hypothetical protein